MISLQKDEILILTNIKLRLVFQSVIKGNYKLSSNVVYLFFQHFFTVLHWLETKHPTAEL
jgi:hypothetical protein